VQDLLHKENGHMVIVITEGARQELLFQNTNSKKKKTGCFWKQTSSRCWALDIPKYKGLIVICSICSMAPLF
jgi:hypothetical protein